MENALIVGGFVTLVFSFVAYLARSKADRLEKDIESKVNIDMCKVLHINLESKFEALIRGQEELKTMIKELDGRLR
jgi:predicted alpha/beta hydrolase family esterase